MGVVDITETSPDLWQGRHALQDLGSASMPQSPHRLIEAIPARHPRVGINRPVDEHRLP